MAAAPFSLSNQRTQAIAAQAAAAAALLLLAILLATTLSDNLARLNMTAGFGFLLRPAGMRMGESVLPFEPTDSFAWAIAAALVNTLRVSAAAIVLATILGTAIGIMRLGANPLLRALTTAYVELFRNTPLLLQILIWSAIFLKLPAIRQAISLGDIAYLSQRGLQLPSLTLHGSPLWPLVAAATAGTLILLVTVIRNAPRKTVMVWLDPTIHTADRARPPKHGRTASLALLSAATAALFTLFLQNALTLDYPIKKAFAFSGGLTLTPEFCALLAGLTAYTAAFIAEIVRGGILAVDHGQWEAARSLGLRDAAILRKIVIPQALRVILPPLTSQYVGIVKNSSLAIAIGYPDLFWAVSTAINVTGHAIEGVATLMAAYLLLTLGLATAMNAWYARMLRQGAAR